MVFFKVFFSGTNGSKYGDRLDTLSSYVISNDKVEDIVSSTKSEKNVESVTYNLQGKLYYFNIYLATNAKAIDGVNAATKLLELFSEKDKSYYDFNFIITKKALVSDESFPIMGYKNSTSSSISWVNY